MANAAEPEPVLNYISVADGPVSVAPFLPGDIPPAGTAFSFKATLLDTRTAAAVQQAIAALRPILPGPYIDLDKVPEDAKVSRTVTYGDLRAARDATAALHALLDGGAA